MLLSDIPLLKAKNRLPASLGKANELLGKIKQRKITMTGVNNGLEGSKKVQLAVYWHSAIPQSNNKHQRISSA